MQVPFALCSQTEGSAIMPASYTGILGMRPTWGSVSVEGQKTCCPTFDTIGFMARSVQDLRLILDVLDWRVKEPPQPVMLKRCKFAMVKTVVWSQAGPGTIAAMARAAQLLEMAGATVQELDLPPEFDKIPLWKDQIFNCEGALTFYKEYQTCREQLGQGIRDFFEKVEQATRKEYLQALDGVAALRPKFDDIADGYTAIVTPSTIDEAPLRLVSEGCAAFNGLWTVCT